MTRTFGEVDWPTTWSSQYQHSKATGQHKKPSKADSAYSRLKSLILTLELEPGQALDERDLMDLIGFGRTPLREAMQRLAHEGLIVTVPRKGSWVSELSLTDLQEMIDARELVEPPIAALAAQRVTDTALDSFRQNVELACQRIDESDYSSCIYLDLDFHRQLSQMSGNRYMARTVDQINTAMLRYWYVSFLLVGDAAPAFAHHRQIIDCVEQRDSGAVEAAIRDHIDIFRRRLHRAIAAPGIRSERS